jgi:hypothetical protein
MGPSLAHAGIAFALFGVGFGAWMLGLRGPHWMGAYGAIAWAWSRELAQKWRSLEKAGPPFTMDNVRQAGWPTLAVLAAATLIEVLR